MTTSSRATRPQAIAAIVFGCAMMAAAPALADHQARVDVALAAHIAAGSQSIDVIVHGDRAEVDALAQRYNLVVKRYLRSGGVLRVTAGQASALQNDPDVDHLSIDATLKSLAIDPIDEGIGADQVWAGAGRLTPLSGKGVTVAVIDSGMDLSHAALRGRVIRSVDFIGGDGVDHFGHGTHVAAIIAGQRGATADTSEYQGVAPGAYLLNLRVLDGTGAGKASDVIEAIDWAIDHQRDYNIRIINLSLGAPVLQSYRDDPVCEAVARAVDAGILVVTAAGNNGHAADGRSIVGGITSPGNSPYAITVGALDTNATPQRSDDSVATFSSMGPTRFDLVLKPDLVAPGRRITSAEAQGSYLSVNFPEQHIAGAGRNGYIRGSGTSMAAAVVSGAAALLIEERPGVKPAALKIALQLTSSFLPEAGLIRAGAGSLNVLAAAEFVRNGKNPEHAIAREIIDSPYQIVGANNRSLFVSSAKKDAPNVLRSNSKSFTSDLGRTVNAIVWTDSGSIVWTDSNAIVWTDSNAIVWTDSDAIVWTDSDAIVWTDSDAIVWTDSNAIVWTDSNAIVWTDSNAIVWTDSSSIVWTE